MTAPLGYTLPSIQTTRDVYGMSVADLTVTTTKSAVQKYINDFLSPTGRYRQYMEAITSPQGLQFVTELSYDDEMKVSPNKRKVYLARFFAENTGRLPCILLIDQGLEIVNPGLSSVMSGYQVGGVFKARYAHICKVTLSIMCATHSQEDTDRLGTSIVSMFSTLADAINQHVLSEPGAPWVVRIPITENPGQISNSPAENDTKTQIWSRTVEMTFEYESLLSIEEPIPTYAPPPEMRVNDQGYRPEFMNFTANQKIPLGMQYPLMVRYLSYHQFLGVSDHRIATVTSEQPWMLQPRAQGKALLLVLDRRIAPLEDTQNNEQNRQLILSVPFEVTR